jgi:HipA-like protein
MKRLRVWWDERVVGDLIQDDHGNMQFEYGHEWVADPSAPPLSASLPKAATKYAKRYCQPFFGGLLPEGNQRTAVAKALGVSANNDFSLLERLGGEVAGAIQLLPPDSVPEASGGPCRMEISPSSSASKKRSGQNQQAREPQNRFIAMKRRFESDRRHQGFQLRPVTVPNLPGAPWRDTFPGGPALMPSPGTPPELASVPGQCLHLRVGGQKSPRAFIVTNMTKKSDRLVQKATDLRSEVWI